MGNVSMEARDINYRGGETKMSVEEALKSTSGEAAAIAALQEAVGNLQTDTGNLQTTKANLITIAPVFSEETAYDPGDLVYNNGLTYRCTNAHEGEWDADDFAATTIDAELKSLNSKFTNLENIKFMSFTAQTVEAGDLCPALSTAIDDYEGSFIGYVECTGKHFIAGYNYFSGGGKYFMAILVQISTGQIYTYNGFNGVYTRNGATMTS